MGIAFAALSILCYNAGYLLEKPALGALPQLGRPSLRWVILLGSSARWVAGFSMMLVGFALRLGALTWAPVSVVQPVLAGGTVAIVLLGRVVLGETLEALDTVAVALLVAGTVAVASSSRSGVNLATRSSWLLLAAMAGVTAVLWMWSAAAPGPARGAALLVTVGLLYGTGAIGEKGVAIDVVRHGILRGTLDAAASPYPWTFLLATLAGMVLFQSALQQHQASLLVPAANGTSSLYALLGAVVVFGEPWSAAGWRVGLLVAGYGLVTAGLALLVVAATRSEHRGRVCLGAPPVTQGPRPARTDSP